MSEVTPLSRPYKGLQGREQGKDPPSAPGKERRRSRASLLSRWGPQSPSAKGVGRREPGWRLRPPLPPARSLRGLCPQRCSRGRGPRGRGLPRALAALGSRPPGCSLQRGAPSARPPRPSPGPPLRPQGARSHCRCARPGRRRWGGRAWLSAAGSPARPAHCPRARDAAAPAQTQSPRLGVARGLRPRPGVAASPGAMRACAGRPMPRRSPCARRGRLAPSASRR